MTLAEQMQANIHYQEVLTKIRSEIAHRDSVFIPSNLLDGDNLARLKRDGFSVQDGGYQQSGGVHVSFQSKGQYY